MFLAAHRNMPLKDAITLISRNFEDYKLAQINRNDKGASAVRPGQVPVVPIAAVGPPILVQEKHPEAIQVQKELRPLELSHIDQFKVEHMIMFHFFETCGLCMRPLLSVILFFLLY